MMGGKTMLKLAGRLKWTHIRSEFFLLITIVCILQSVLLGFVIWNIDARILFENEKRNLTQLLNVVNEDLESRVGSIDSMALDIVISSEVKSNLNNSAPLEVARSKSAVNSFLSKKVISSSNTLLDLSIIDLQENTYSTRAAYFLPRDFRLDTTDEFKVAEGENGALVWLDGNGIIDRYSNDSYFAYNPLSGLRAVALIKDYTRRTVLGLLMVSIKDDFFSRIDYSNSTLERVEMHLVSPSGRTVLPVAGSSPDLDRSIIERVDPSRDRDAFVMPDAAKTVVSYIHNDALGWTLVSNTASSNISSSFSSIIRALTIALLISLAAAILISWWSSNFITRGIRELAEKMRFVEVGDFDVQINSERSDEIGMLSRSFDQMVRRIKELIEKTYKQRLLTQQAEFRALQGQINPHFLYNTLDMINWRLLANNQEDISRSVVSLGMILQYSMGAEAIVSLDQEIQNMEAYLELRKSNKDPDFSYSISASDCEEIRLPKLTLQPLVENAIIHGFGRRRSGNELSVRAHRCPQDRYQIEIMDNGMGMDEGTLASVLNFREFALDKTKETRPHVGLKNVDERLKYMYGPSFGLEVTSEPGLGTTISVVIPAAGGKREDRR
jgi:two-component system, sensor histidine kinase YesM